MVHVLPRRPAALGKPRIERFQIRPTSFSRLTPDLPAPVLNVLLDEPLLPTGGAVAEFRLEQRLEARVDRALLVATDLVHRSPHVVVDAPTRHSAEGAEGAAVRIE